MKRDALFCSGRRISAFLAVQGATDTDTIFLGSIFIFFAKYVFTIADSIAIQLRAEEI